MTSRFKQFGASFGSKRQTNRNGNGNSQTQTPPTSNLQPASAAGVVHTPTGSTSSTTSLPMNQQPNGLGRPPSYTYNPNAPRAQSPLPPPQQQQVGHHPPPINTGGYPQGHPALAGGNVQPPGYGGGYAQNGIHGGMPQPSLAPYGRGPQAVEVEGAGRSKAQLIVGIDFVRLECCSHNEFKAYTSI